MNALPEVRVLHADSWLVAVDKPSGVPSVPARDPHEPACVARRLLDQFGPLEAVHRLDRDTSGVIIFGLTPHAQRTLSMQFEQRTTKKIYIARVAGEVAEKTGQIDLPLIVDWPNRPRQMVCHDTGKPAVTNWVRMSSGNGESRLRLFPQTGRSHQLRVHCLSIGHPILGDPLYAAETVADHPRMMLHSQELRINHPESGIGMKFRAPVPF